MYLCGKYIYVYAKHSVDIPLAGYRRRLFFSKTTTLKFKEEKQMLLLAKCM